MKYFPFPLQTPKSVIDNILEMDAYARGGISKTYILQDINTPLWDKTQVSNGNKIYFFKI